MMTLTPQELAALVTLALEPLGLTWDRLLARLEDSQVPRAAGEAAVRGLAGRGLLMEQEGHYLPTPRGHAALRETYAALEQAQDVSPSSEDMEECPSLPWLTQVQT